MHYMSKVSHTTSSGCFWYIVIPDAAAAEEEERAYSYFFEEINPENWLSVSSVEEEPSRG